MNKDKRNNIQLLGTLNNSDESGIIANANQIYDANEDKSTQDVSKEHTERIKTLEDKENSMQTTLENITKTGEASAASNVTYNHSDSKLDATNVQQAVDEMRELINTHEGNIEELQDNVNEINQEIQVTDNGPDDFSIQDEAGNILCLWKDGHIKTKNFLSSTLNQVIFDSTDQTTNKANYGTIEDLDKALTPGVFLWKQNGKQVGIVQCFLDNLNHALTQILCTNFQLTDADNNVLNLTDIADKDYAKKGTFISPQHTMHTYVRTYGYTDDFANNQSSAQKLEKGWSGWVGLLLDSEWYSNLKLICQSWFKNFSNTIIDDGPDDFSIQDEEGNILCLWKDGHIKTKNFDSEKVATKEEVASIEHPVEVNENSDSDLDVADENGNVLARFKDGHIKTKNFDSEKVATKEEFSKIKFVAFGDSITDSDTSIGSCLGDVICNFLGTKRINNWARGNATMSDYSSITDGIRNNITPINLAYPPNSTVPYNVISNQVLRMLQWTTPLNKQIEWNHNIDGRFSINTSYGTGLGHTSDIPDIIYIAGGTNDTKDSYRCVDDTETVFGQTYSNLTRITIASALRWIIETLQSVYPLAHIFVASPLQTSRGWNWDSGGYTGLRTQSTWQVRQIIEKVTRFESVHFIDSYSESGFNNLIATKINDGIHPKGIWRDAIAKYVSNEIKNKYYNR